MADEYCRITVVGDRRQVDLAVPAGAPITDYVDDLARLCALEENALMPPAWSLATALAGPFAPERSLAELGVADGQVLYLRDLLAGELDEPVVLDVAEQVAQASNQWLDRPWDASARAATALAVGLAWLAAVLLALAGLRPVGPVAVGAAAAVAGTVVPLLAWVAGERRWSVPPALRIGAALTAVPALAVAGWCLPAVRPGHGPGSAGALAGALLGALLGYAAASGVTTLAVLGAVLVAAVTGGGLVGLGADRAQSAAVSAVVAFLLLSAAPVTAGRIVAVAFRRRDPVDPSGDPDEGEQVRLAVHTAMTLLAVWSAVLSAVLAAALVLLAVSHTVYGAGLAGCLALALLLRAGAAKVVVEVVPGALAGTAGVFALLLTGPGALHWPAWTAPVLLAAVALGLLGYGLRKLLRRDLRALPRPAWLGPLGAVLGALGIPLLLAGFGLFGQLMGLGRHL
ncbi:EsaB/YukD family protein [Kitasatospora sp. NPDC058965]|uniref:EsaB/YukD family protein n=1 Tax=Kitasatospora sp. NPDC058965 TaxID=3346682 RepID=UPI00367A0839